MAWTEYYSSMQGFIECPKQSAEFSSSPGVHWLQDPRSRVYNFPPYLENIPKVTDFDFDRLTGFIKSSRDEVRRRPFLFQKTRLIPF